MALLSVSGLEKSYGTDTIFSGVSFEIQENERIGLVGVNGGGKTTLFRLLTGSLTPDNNPNKPISVIWNSMSAVIPISALMLKY